MFGKLTRDEHLHGGGPKRVLSLDGGGVRGLVSLGILKKLQTELRLRYGPDTLLCDYFDLIGGTSTGALIATLLALGYDVDRITALYHEAAPKIFRNARWFSGIQSKFDTNALADAVRSNLSDFLRVSKRNPDDVDSLRLGSDTLKTGLGLVCKRIDTGSVWVLTNNPKAKYWDANSHLWAKHLGGQGVREFYPNSDYLLATLVQASASAPYYLDGVKLKISPTETGQFLDGGASPFNNPCQELFLMTTLRARGPGWNDEGVSPFGFKWETGADRYYMLSVGTGYWRPAVSTDEFDSWSAAYKAIHALRTVLNDSSVNAISWMQAIAETPRPFPINANLLDMRGLRIVDTPLLRYRRVDAFIEPSSLRSLLGDKGNFSLEVLERTRQLDNPDRANLKRLEEIGIATGEAQISAEDLPAAFDIGAV